jgi:hypothetical protein
MGLPRADLTCFGDLKMPENTISLPLYMVADRLGEIGEIATFERFQDEPALLNDLDRALGIAIVKVFEPVHVEITVATDLSDGLVQAAISEFLVIFVARGPRSSQSASNAHHERAAGRYHACGSDVMKSYLRKWEQATSSGRASFGDRK